MGVGKLFLVLVVVSLVSGIAGVLAFQMWDKK